MKVTAHITRQIHAHLGLGTLRDEAALAQSKAEVSKENKIIFTQEQKKRDINALEAEQKVQEQKMTWAQKTKSAQSTMQQRKTPITLD